MLVYYNIDIEGSDLVNEKQNVDRCQFSVTKVFMCELKIDSVQFN